jgi:hypothetical protein
LFRADSHRSPPSLIASAMPVWASVTEVLVITDAPSGMRASTARRAESRSSTTSTLNPCSSSATTVACSACSSGNVVNRSGTAGALISDSSLMQLTGWSIAPKLLGIMVSDPHHDLMVSRIEASPAGESRRISGDFSAACSAHSRTFMVNPVLSASVVRITVIG